MEGNEVLGILVGILFTVIGLTLIFAVLFGVVYSKLVAEDVKTRNAWKQIDHVFKERVKIIPTLLAVFERYVSSEKKLMRELLDITSIIANVGATEDLLHQKGRFLVYEQGQIQLTLGIRRLMALTEKYPDVVRVPEFVTFNLQLDAAENRIATESRAYNQVVHKFNRMIEIFPTSMVAQVLQYNKKIPFSKEMSAEQLMKSSQ